MKPVVALIGIFVAGLAGYFLEPSIRPGLIPRQGAEKPETTGESGGKASDGQEQPKPEPVVPTPYPAAPAPPAWVADLKPEQFPEKVTLKRSVEFSAPGAAQAMVMEAGTQATPVRIEGSDLVVSLVPGGPIEGRVAVMETDLVQLLGNAPPTPAPPVADPPPVAGGTEMEDPEPEPEPEPEPAPVAALDAEGIVKLMQDSIKGEEIKEFTFDQVLGWKAGEEEERDGETYQTGLVAYKAETIFGVKNIQAQALIKDGAIVRWIWPKSGMEIK